MNISWGYNGTRGIRNRTKGIRNSTKSYEQARLSKAIIQNTYKRLQKITDTAVTQTFNNCLNTYALRCTLNTMTIK